MNNTISNSDLITIQELLASSNPDDLTEARRLARIILDSINDGILNALLYRQRLMAIIAASKRQGEPILQLQREFEIILAAQNKATESWEDPDFSEMIMWLITAAGKEKQRKILNRNSVFVEEQIDRTTLTENLLRLTARVAENYDHYGDAFSATRITRDVEMDWIERMVQSLAHKGIVLDLGCANGSTSRILAKYGFDKVVGYDISPDMVRVAEEKKLYASEQYHVHDLSGGIPEENNSVDCVIANFWSASEITDNLLQEVNRVLRKNGKAWLSFYNKEAFAHTWWQPWQTSIEVVLNPLSDVLEVPIISNDGRTCEVYKIYAKPCSLTSINEQLERTDLLLWEVSSFPFLFTMMPPTFFQDDTRVQKALEFDTRHWKMPPYNGYYLNVVLQKK